MRVLGTKLEVLVITEPSHQLLAFFNKEYLKLESYNSLTRRISQVKKKQQQMFSWVKYEIDV